MNYYYNLLKDEKLKKIIRAQMIIMWIPLIGSVASIIMMQAVLFKRDPEKAAVYDMSLILSVIILVSLFFVFHSLISPGTAALFYITAFAALVYPAAYFGLLSEIRIVYDLQEQAETEERAEEKKRAETGEEREELDAPGGDGAPLYGPADESAVHVWQADNVTEYAVAPKRLKAIRMTRAAADRAFIERAEERANNFAKHEEKTLNRIYIYLTPEKQSTLREEGVEISFSLIWLETGARERTAEIRYDRPGLTEGYTGYLSLSVLKGGERKSMLFKLSELRKSSMPLARSRIYYQDGKIIRAIEEYLI